MDLLKRQEIVIEKSTELKQLVGLALSLDECEEFVSDVLKASDKPSNCILADVSNRNEVRELLIAYDIRHSKRHTEETKKKVAINKVDNFLSNL